MSYKFNCIGYVIHMSHNVFRMVYDRFHDYDSTYVIYGSSVLCPTGLSSCYVICVILLTLLSIYFIDVRRDIF